MNRLFPALLVVSLTFIFSKASAQTHTFNKPNSACRFSTDKRVVKGGVRNNLEGFVVCPACDADDKKESVAKAKEDQRLANIVLEKDRLDKIAKDAKDKKQKDEDAKKNQVTQVYVTAPKVTATAPVKTKPTTAIPASPSKEKNYFYTETNDVDNQSIRAMHRTKAENYFLINKQKVFTNNEFKVCIGSLVANRDPAGCNFPPNVGIVILHETFTDKFNNQIQISDLVDAKGQRILNDNSISTIVHFADDYFIAFRGEPQSRWGNNDVRFYANRGDAFIYNLKTKEKHTLRRYLSDEGKDLGYEFDYVVNLRYGNDIDFSKYKARFKSKVAWTESIAYYITKDGKLEEHSIKQ